LFPASENGRADRLGAEQQAETPGFPQVFLLPHAQPNLLPPKLKQPGTAKRSIARVHGETLPSENQFSLEYSKDSSPSRAAFLKYFSVDPQLFWRKSCSRKPIFNLFQNQLRLS